MDGAHIKNKTMTKLALINNIARIRTGYTFRKIESASESSGLLGLQINDLRHTRVIEPAQLSAIEWKGKGKPPVLLPGEVVLAAKGNHNRAALFPENDSSVVPSNQFLVLSVRNPECLSPEYLCWALNYPATQQQMAELQSGSSIPSISKKSLQGMSIPLPPLKTQQKILRLNRLWEEEASLTQALLANRATQLQGLFQALISGAK